MKMITSRKQITATSIFKNGFAPMNLNYQNILPWVCQNGDQPNCEKSNNGQDGSDVRGDPWCAVHECHPQKSKTQGYDSCPEQCCFESIIIPFGSDRWIIQKWFLKGGISWEAVLVDDCWICWACGSAKITLNKIIVTVESWEAV